MNSRVFFGFVLLISFATSSFAQIGEIEDVIEAAASGQQPKYVNEIMRLLTERIKPLLRKDLARNPKVKLFCFQAMFEVMSATLEQAMKASEQAAIEFGRSKKAVAKAGATSNWFTAVDAAFKASPFEIYAMSFIDSNVNKDCWYDALQGARAALRSEKESHDAATKAGERWTPHPEFSSIAFQGAQWGALNWLLKNTDIVRKTYDEIFPSYFVSKNPFATKASSNELYEKYFGLLSEEKLVFLSPILVCLFAPKKENFSGFMQYQPTLEEIAQATLMFGYLPNYDIATTY